MKFIYQLGIILVITFIGEVVYRLIPLPIPAGIYGLLIMLLCLKTKIVKIEKVNQAGGFLLEIMPLMFIPAAVGLISVWKELAGVLLPVITITFLTTVIVMAATGKMAQFIIYKGKSEEK
jgi:holin-like protein